MDTLSLADVCWTLSSTGEPSFFMHLYSFVLWRVLSGGGTKKGRRPRWLKLIYTECSMKGLWELIVGVCKNNEILWLTADYRAENEAVLNILSLPRRSC